MKPLTPNQLLRILLKFDFFDNKPALTNLKIIAENSSDTMISAISLNEKKKKKKSTR